MRELYHAARMRLLDFLVDLALPPRETGAERGYNQIERVARYALSNGQSALRAEIDTGLLIRTRETLPQTSLSGNARRRNVAGAFATSRACEPYRTYIVVDDVITTGNTMLAACQALRAAGTLRLLRLTLAY